MAATAADYAAVSAALQAVLQSDINNEVPGWAAGFIPPDLAANLSPALAKTAVDVLDKFRATEKA